MKDQPRLSLPRLALMVFAMVALASCESVDDKEAVKIDDKYLIESYTKADNSGSNSLSGVWMSISTIGYTGFGSDGALASSTLERRILIVNDKGDGTGSINTCDPNLPQVNFKITGNQLTYTLETAFNSYFETHILDIEDSGSLSGDVFGTFIVVGDNNELTNINVEAENHSFQFFGPQQMVKILNSPPIGKLLLNLEGSGDGVNQPNIDVVEYDVNCFVDSGGSALDFRTTSLLLDSFNAVSANRFAVMGQREDDSAYLNIQMDTVNFNAPDEFASYLVFDLPVNVDQPPLPNGSYTRPLLQDDAARVKETQLILSGIDTLDIDFNFERFITKVVQPGGTETADKYASGSIEIDMDPEN